jgi:hypothetical protein
MRERFFFSNADCLSEGEQVEQVELREKFCIGRGNMWVERGAPGPIAVPLVPLCRSTLIRHFSFEYHLFPLFHPELEASPQPTAAQLLLGWAISLQEVHKADRRSNSEQKPVWQWIRPREGTLTAPWLRSSAEPASSAAGSCGSCSIMISRSGQHRGTRSGPPRCSGRMPLD